MAFDMEQPKRQVMYHHGHSVDQVIIVVKREGQPDEQLAFSAEQAMQFIEAMRRSLQALIELQQANLVPPGKRQ